MSNPNIWIGLAFITYAVLRMCITSITARHNRARQFWRREDDYRVEVKQKEEREGK